MKKQILLSALFLMAGSTLAHAVDAATVEAEVKAKVAVPVIMEAVRAQNERYAGLDEAGIKALDAQWRTEADAADRPLIDKTLASPASLELKKVMAQSGGRYVEIFVMDNKGLNVAQSGETSDFWQGDEAKFQESYGADATFVDEPEYDESAQAYITQVSVPLHDDAGALVGAVTVGVKE